jgi:hypothetical protein
MYKLTPQQFGMIFESLRTAGASRGSEKRQSTRMEVQTKFQLASLSNGSVARCYSALSRDISCTGVGFFQFAPVGNAEKLLTCFPCGKEELVLMCLVMFCRPMADGLFCVGVQFEGVASEAVIKQLNDLRNNEIDRIRASVLS